MISKTMFKNYIRCPRYCALDDAHKKKQSSMITIDSDTLDLNDLARKEKLNDLLHSMYDEDESKIDVENEHLKVMMPYFNQLEVIAGHELQEIFGENINYSLNNFEQKNFQVTIDDYSYQCFLDGFQENEDGSFNVFEVKATTAKKFIELGKTKKGMSDKKLFEKINSIFTYDNRVLRLKTDIDSIPDYDDELTENVFNKQLEKMRDKYSSVGKYVYDLAVERYMIESFYHKSNQLDKLEKGNYYLVVLNPEYVFEGEYKDGKPHYKKDPNGNSIVSVIDLTSVTKDLQAYIELDRKRIESYLDDLDAKEVKLGKYCERKRTTECKYKNEVCWTFIPEKNSIFTYLGYHHGFKDEDGTKYELYELLNMKKVKATDISHNLIQRPNNVIQRKVIDTKKPFINKAKIKAGLKQLTYPIYHLDFETFPCPLPRFSGETPYRQSLFQYSLHIEEEINKCDKEKDHYEFLARDHSDVRYQMMKHLIDNIDLDNGGTILVYNAGFERTRLKEMAILYPDLRIDLNRMIDMLFDLLDVIKTKASMYEEIGFDKNEAKEVNYYHEDLNGSYSIKKVLPIFSDLTYKGMDVSNGMEAVYTYASYMDYEGEDLQDKQQALVEYCKQDTWAMFEVLRGLREMVGD